MPVLMTMNSLSIGFRRNKGIIPGLGKDHKNSLDIIVRPSNFLLLKKTLSFYFLSDRGCAMGGRELGSMRSSSRRRGTMRKFCIAGGNFQGSPSSPLPNFLLAASVGTLRSNSASLSIHFAPSPRLHSTKAPP